MDVRPPGLFEQSWQLDSTSFVCWNEHCAGPDPPLTMNLASYSNCTRGLATTTTYTFTPIPVLSVSTSSFPITRVPGAANGTSTAIAPTSSVVITTVFLTTLQKTLFWTTLLTANTYPYNTITLISDGTPVKTITEAYHTTYSKGYNTYPDVFLTTEYITSTLWGCLDGLPRGIRYLVDLY